MRDASKSEASLFDPQDRQRGRRVEADRSWAAYHVFAAVPANVGFGMMTGLSRAEATRRTISRCARATSRFGYRLRVRPPALDASA